jgi:hypothetical protein
VLEIIIIIISETLGIETTDKWYTHMPKPIYEKKMLHFFWNHAVHTDREVTANTPDILIKNKKEKTCIEKCRAKRSGNVAQVQDFMYKDASNVASEM